MKSGVFRILRKPRGGVASPTALARKVESAFARDVAPEERSYRGSESVCSHQDRRRMAEESFAATVRRIAWARDRSTRIVRVADGASFRHIRVCRMWTVGVRGGSEVRKWYWMAELLRTGRRIDRHDRRSQLRNDAHRSALQPVRRTSRPCVSRWAAADRTALLHQRHRARVYAAGRPRRLVINNLWI
jgi:hypothetical protein